MNIELIREFVVLSDELSFSAAADKMFISRSALSKHIQAIEAELDVKLLSRSNQAVALTEAGNDFAHSARLLLKSYDESVSHARAIAANCTRAIRVGYLFESVGKQVSHACEEFRTMHDCHVVLRAMEVHAIRQGVARDDLDLGVTMAFPELLDKDYACVSMLSDEYGIVVPSNHPLAQKDSVVVSDLDGLYVHGPNPDHLPDHERVLSKYIKAHGSAVTVIADIFDIGSLHPIMSMGAEALFAPRHIGESINNGLTFIPLADFERHPALCLIWKKRNERDDIIDLVECISNSFEAMRH